MRGFCRQRKVGIVHMPLLRVVHIHFQSKSYQGVVVFQQWRKDAKNLFPNQALIGALAFNSARFVHTHTHTHTHTVSTHWRQKYYCWSPTFRFSSHPKFSDDPLPPAGSRDRASGIRCRGDRPRSPARIFPLPAFGHPLPPAGEGKACCPSTSSRDQESEIRSNGGHGATRLCLPYALPIFHSLFPLRSIKCSVSHGQIKAK